MTKLDYRSLRLSQPHTDHSLFLSDMRRTKLSYQQGSREKDRPEHPHSSLSPLQLVKEEQKMCEAPPKDTLPMIYICYSMHLQELQMPFFIPASHAWCSLPQESLPWTFSQWVLLLHGSWGFSQQKWKIRLVKTKLLVLVGHLHRKLFLKAEFLSYCFHTDQSSKGE